MSDHEGRQSAVVAEANVVSEVALHENYGEARLAVIFGSLRQVHCRVGVEDNQVTLDRITCSHLISVQNDLDREPIGCHRSGLGTTAGKNQGGSCQHPATMLPNHA